MFNTFHTSLKLKCIITLHRDMSTKFDTGVCVTVACRRSHSNVNNTVSLLILHLSIAKLANKMIFNLSLRLIQCNNIGGLEIIL